MVFEYLFKLLLEVIMRLFVFLFVEGFLGVFFIIKLYNNSFA